MTHTKHEALNRAQSAISYTILALSNGNDLTYAKACLESALTAIKQARSAPVQEPVASLLAAIQAEPVTLIHKWRVLELVKDHAAQPAPVQPVAFDDWPEYHEHAMGCGLEDRGITDRYEAMRYGWDEALERAWEAVNLHSPLYTTPPAPAPVPSTLPDFSPIFDGITKGGAA
jgi:hypothetical protein